MSAVIEQRRVQEQVRARLFRGRGQPIRIGRFVVLQRLGSGGMGVVYSARDPELGREIAIKLLRPARDDDDSQRRLLLEAQAMAKLSHQNVVTVHEVGEHEGQVFIAMELVRGQTLREWASDEPRTWRQVLDLMVQAGRGLAAAHEAGLVHRDFKPDNVLVGTDSNRVWVVDFLAAGGEVSATGRELVTGDTKVMITRTGALVGTPAYMAPEQWEANPADARSDQYGFCVTFWELLHGERPDPDRSTIRERRSPAWLRRVLHRGLEQHPAARWSSMSALVEALEADPTSRRRWSIALGVGVVGIAGALGGQRWYEASIVHDCERQSDVAATAIWGPDQRTSVAKAFAAIELSYAADTAERVEHRLDAYVNDWRGQMRAVCLDAAHETAPREDLELRQRCLAHRRASAETLVSIFSKPDPQVAIGATSAVTRLPALEPCEEPGRVARLLPGTETTAHALVVESLARAHALGTTGKLDAAVEEALRALEKGRELEAQGLIAAARFQVGRWGNALHREDVSEQLTQAFHGALGQHLDALALEATVALVNHGWIRGDLEEAHRWSALGRTVVERLQGSEPELTLELEHQIASLVDERGDHQAADRQLAAVVERAIELFGPDHPRTLRFRGTHYSIKFARTEGEHRMALIPGARELLNAEMDLLGPRHPFVATELSNLANALHHAGQCGAARQTIDKALSIDEEAQGPQSISFGHDLYVKSFILHGCSDLGEALSVARRAHTVLAEAGPESQSYAWNLKAQGLLLRDLGRLGEAKAMLEQAVERFSVRFGSDHFIVAELQYEIGTVLKAQGDVAGAATLFEQVLGANEVKTYGRAGSAWELAQILDASGEDAARARALALEALELHATFGVLHTPQMMRIAAWLGEHPA